MIPRPSTPILTAVLAGLMLAAAPRGARADLVPQSEQVERKEPLPRRLVGVDVKEHLSAPVPMDLGFEDENGKPATLKDYFDGSVPVILTMNYSNCPMLCSLQLNALVDGLKKVDWTIGKEYRIVTISFDQNETAELAHRTKARYLAQYGRPGSEGGWHFLHGSENNVQAMAKALGITYHYNEARKEYVHPATVVLTTPNGKIDRYLYGLEYPQKTLHLSLVESSEGKIGTTVDQLILFCFHYDANEGRYAPVARNIMRAGGGATVFLLAGFLTVLSKRDKKRKNESEEQ
ncbi:MAG TPA: SCO family protein [Polyangiaceae bacterium]|nr:SCO family protein [Polyangiaceae bacterium]